MKAKRRQQSAMLAFLEALCRNMLTIVGAIAFGVGGATLANYGLLTAMTGGIKQDGWGAGPAWLVIMAIGGVFGLIAGLVWAIVRIRRREPRAWGPVEWLGVVVGVVVSVALLQLVSDRYLLFMKILLAAVIVPPFAVIGRAIGGLIGAERQR